MSQDKLPFTGQYIRNVLKDSKRIRKLTKAAFDEIDTDGSGDIDRHELKAVMLNVAEDTGGDDPTEEEIDAVLKELDDDDQGTITVDEFEILIR